MMLLLIDCEKDISIFLTDEREMKLSSTRLNTKRDYRELFEKIFTI